MMKSNLLWVGLAVFLFTACTTSSHQPKPSLSASNQHIDVYKSDGSRQYQGVSLTPEQMKHQLGNVVVYAMQKDHLNRAYPAVCGGETGVVNRYTIDKKDWAYVEKLGFELWVDE